MLLPEGIPEQENPDPVAERAAVFSSTENMDSNSENIIMFQ